MLKHHSVRDPTTVAAQRMVGMELVAWWQQRVELDPDGFQQR
jgi:hypothetical protein